eukprot:scaffold9467_cov89-Phaeocystis_antarctica.AAC.1
MRRLSCVAHRHGWAQLGVHLERGVTAAVARRFSLLVHVHLASRMSRSQLRCSRGALCERGASAVTGAIVPRVPSASVRLLLHL